MIVGFLFQDLGTMKEPGLWKLLPLEHQIYSWI